MGGHCAFIGASQVTSVRITTSAERSDRWEKIAEEVARAESRFRDGDYHACVAVCRMVVEELGHRLFARTDWAGPSLDRFKSKRREMSKDEREAAILAALHHYNVAMPDLPGCDCRCSLSVSGFAPGRLLFASGSAFGAPPPELPRAPARRCARDGRNGTGRQGSRHRAAGSMPSGGGAATVPDGVGQGRHAPAMHVQDLAAAKDGGRLVCDFGRDPDDGNVGPGKQRADRLPVGGGVPGDEAELDAAAAEPFEVAARARRAARDQ